MSTTTHPWIQDAINRMEWNIARVRARQADCETVSRFLAECGFPAEGTDIQDTGTIAIAIYPDRLDDVAPLLRKLRDHFGEKLTPHPDPDQSRINYHGGSIYVCAWLKKSCTFKQVGTQMVEKPIYEVTCS